MERASNAPKNGGEGRKQPNSWMLRVRHQLGTASRSAKGFCQGDRDRVISGHLFLSPSDAPRFLSENKVVGQDRCTGVLARPIPESPIGLDKNQQVWPDFETL